MFVDSVLWSFFWEGGGIGERRACSAGHPIKEARGSLLSESFRQLAIS